MFYLYVFFIVLVGIIFINLKKSLHINTVSMMLFSTFFHLLYVKYDNILLKNVSNLLVLLAIVDGMNAYYAERNHTKERTIKYLLLYTVAYLGDQVIPTGLSLQYYLLGVCFFDVVFGMVIDGMVYTPSSLAILGVFFWCALFREALHLPTIITIIVDPVLLIPSFFLLSKGFRETDRQKKRLKKQVKL